MAGSQIFSYHLRRENYLGSNPGPFARQVTALTTKPRLLGHEMFIKPLNADLSRNRWNRCVEWTNKKLGMAVGALFIRDHFNHDSKVSPGPGSNLPRTPGHTLPMSLG